MQKHGDVSLYASWQAPRWLRRNLNHFNVTQCAKWFLSHGDRFPAVRWFDLFPQEECRNSPRSWLTNCLRSKRYKQNMYSRIFQRQLWRTELQCQDERKHQQAEDRFTFTVMNNMDWKNTFLCIQRSQTRRFFSRNVHIKKSARALSFPAVKLKRLMAPSGTFKVRRGLSVGSTGRGWLARSVGLVLEMQNEMSE